MAKWSGSAVLIGRDDEMMGTLGFETVFGAVWPPARPEPIEGGWHGYW